MSKDVYAIELKDGPVPFDAVIQSKLVPATELAKIVNSIFTATFKDFEGSFIPERVSPDGHIRSVTLFFKDKGGKEMVPLANPTGDGNSLASRVLGHNARLSTKTYRLSDTVRNVLEPLMIKNNFNQGIDWGKAEVEIPEPNPVMYGTANIYLRVENIDINKVLKIYFGGSNPESNEVADYDVSFVRALYNGVSLLRIDRANKLAVDKLVQEAGLMSQSTNAVSMVRGV